MAAPASLTFMSSEMLELVRRIHIKTKYLVNDAFAGEYETAFRGRGMEFEEVREYVPGDDIRFIDWNVTARIGHPFIKVFREERELTVMLLVDVSPSGQFGTVKAFKNEIAAELAAVLAYTAIRNNDKVGLIIFTDIVEHFTPPSKRSGHVWRLIKEVLTFQPKGRGTDLNKALEFLGRVITRKAVCFIISDFITEGYEKMLRMANERFDLVALAIVDPREERLPRLGIMEFEDAETGEIVLVDTGDLKFLRDFEMEREREEERLLRNLRLAKVDYVPIRTDQSYVDPLAKFFRIREKRR